MKKLKILIISDEVWSDKIHGNNVLSNWFDGFDAEFANIYCSPGEPSNNCCKKYFQVTDTMMVKSIIKNKKAGNIKYYNQLPGSTSFKLINENIIELENKKLYSRLKSITTETMRAIRELIWIIGKYDIDKLDKFIKEFNPDIIFAPRLSTLKLLRLEQIVYEIAKVPIVAFTGDDEYSLRQLRFTPVYWIMRFIKRKKMRSIVPMYSLYYTHSEDQAKEYNQIFNIPTKNLLKCGVFTKEKTHSYVNKPIKIVYAGKLYCNRWKSLSEIGKALKIINKDEVKMTLEIYTKDKITRKQAKYLDDGRNIFIRGPVGQDDLKRIYSKSDILLHVESFDLKNRLLTRVSFSTKIIDCLASGCAVMAMCWEKHAGFKYLKKEDAAFMISDKKDIYSILKRITENPKLVTEYANKAVECGIKNHKKEFIQEMLYKDFESILKDKV